MKITYTITVDRPQEGTTSEFRQKALLEKMLKVLPAWYIKTDAQAEWNEVPTPLPPVKRTAKVALGCSDNRLRCSCPSCKKLLQK